MLRSAALSIVRTLQKQGHEAVFAGGCVRDTLLGLAPADYDIATSARPEDVEAIFADTIPVGRQFGILLVPAEGHHFEVATFREDAEYLDGRHPTAVRYSSIEADAQRRDFTINAMFEDPVGGRILDFIGGKADLAAGIIRAVGDPEKRFAEDRLRLLRAVRFASRFGFPIQSATAAAIQREAAHITEVSAERIGEEIVRMLTEGNARRAFELMDSLGLLGHVMPEIPVLKTCMQSPDFHPEGDVFRHTMLCLSHLQPGCTETLALGVLLHDVAKPACAATTEDGRRTFYGHPNLGAEMAVEICRRLRRSNAVADRVAWLVDEHLRHTSAAQMRASTLKRFLRQEGIEELLELTRIDALSSSGDLSHYEFARRALDALPVEAMRPPRLLTGEDLKAMGLEPGPQYRDILQAIEDAQLEGTVTTRADALELVRVRISRD